MAQQAPISLGHIPAGHTFPPLRVSFAAAQVHAYLGVVEAEGLRESGGEELVPPATAATLALGALLERVSLPAGTLHAAQEIEARAALPAGSAATCRAAVTGRATRGGTIFVTLEFSLESPTGTVALEGKATLLVPEA